MGWVWVFLGGGLGASARYGIIGAFGGLSAKFAWPVGVFFVNVLGCFLLGLIAPIILKFALQEMWTKLVLTGFLGGFTTFSTYSFEAVTLIQSGHIATAALYLFGSVLVGCFAVAAGLFLSQFIFGQ